MMGPHKSRPYNPLIANTFFRAGFIEAWGRGIQKIKDSCIQAGNDIPQKFEKVLSFLRANSEKEMADVYAYGIHDYANERYQKYDYPEEWLDEAEEIDEWIKDNEEYIGEN